MLTLNGIIYVLEERCLTGPSLFLDSKTERSFRRMKDNFPIRQQLENALDRAPKYIILTIS